MPPGNWTSARPDFLHGNTGASGDPELANTLDSIVSVQALCKKRLRGRGRNKSNRIANGRRTTTVHANASRLPRTPQPAGRLMDADGLPKNSTRFLAALSTAYFRYLDGWGALVPDESCCAYRGLTGDPKI